MLHGNSVFRGWWCPSTAAQRAVDAPSMAVPKAMGGPWAAPKERCPHGKGWDWVSLKVPSNPNHSTNPWDENTGSSEEHYCSPCNSFLQLCSVCNPSVFPTSYSWLPSRNTQRRSTLTYAAIKRNFMKLNHWPLTWPLNISCLATRGFFLRPNNGNVWIWMASPINFHKFLFTASILCQEPHSCCAEVMHLKGLETQSTSQEDVSPLAPFPPLPFQFHGQKFHSTAPIEKHRMYQVERDSQGT